MTGIISLRVILFSSYLYLSSSFINSGIETSSSWSSPDEWTTTQIHSALLWLKGACGTFSGINICSPFLTRVWFSSLSPWNKVHSPSYKYAIVSMSLWIWGSEWTPGGIGNTFMHTFSDPAVFLDTPELYVTPCPPRYVVPGFTIITFFFAIFIISKSLCLFYIFSN